MYHCERRFITELFYKRGQIKMQHLQQKFIAELFRGRGLTMLYTITEQKDAEYKEYSVTKEVTSYFNIFECGRNLLDQLDVKYQRAFMATSAHDEYYREMTKSLIKVNIRSGGKICNEKIHRAVLDLRAELNLEHERNINNIISEDVYTSLMKKKETKRSMIRYIMSRMRTQIQ